MEKDKIKDIGLLHDSVDFISVDFDSKIEVNGENYYNLIQYNELGEVRIVGVVSLANLEKLSDYIQKNLAGN